MNELNLTVGSIRCIACKQIIEMELGEKEGIFNTEVAIKKRLVKIFYNEKNIKKEQLIDEIISLGFSEINEVN